MKYTELSPEEIRREVYLEARRQFLKNGITKTQVKQIAGNVGIGRTTLYRYYPVKEQLAFLVAAEIVEIFFYENLMKQETGLKKLSGFEKINCFCRHFCEAVLCHQEELAFLTEFDSLFIGKYPDIAEAHEYEAAMSQNMKTLTRVIEEGKEDGSIDTDTDSALIASILVNSIMGIGQRTVKRELHIIQEHGKTSGMLLFKTAELLLKSIRQEK